MAGIMLLAYFGATSFYQIPNEVAKVIPNAIENHVEEHRTGFHGQLQEYLDQAENSALRGRQYAMELEELVDKFRDVGVLAQTGMVEIYKKEVPELWNVESGHCPEGDKGKRGKLNRRVNFSKAFESPPEVLMALSNLDFSRKRNLRIAIFVRNIDKEGFDYDLHTWCDTQVRRARAFWIAVAT